MLLNRTALSLVGVCLIATPVLISSAEAQACLGNPITSVGQLAVNGGLDFIPDRTAYGVGLAARPIGRLYLGAGVSVAPGTANRGNRQTLSTSAAIEGRVGRVSVCPYSGFSLSRSAYTSPELNGAATFWQVPVGLAVGGNFPLGDDVSILPFLAPHLLLNGPLSGPNGSEGMNSTLGATVGTTVQAGRYYLTGAFSRGPEMSISVGRLFR
jgi:hypothetical protein